MFGLCCKRLQLVVASSVIAVDSGFRYLCFPTSFITSFSSRSEIDKPHNEKHGCFAVTYFINTFGFSPDVAISLFKKHTLRFESPEKPDSVIKLLKLYGLDDTHVSEIAKKRPDVFLSNTEKILLPKLEFFGSIGISGTALARLVSMNPRILALSLERSLKPCYHITKTLLIPDEKLPRFLSDYRRNSFKKLCIVASNVKVVRAHGVPQSSFPLWLPLYFHALSLDSEKVKKNVDKVISMGFSPSSATFMKALYVISVMDASKWKLKVKFYSKWGWTENDVLLAFRRSPLFMSFSEKTILGKLDFYMNVMGCHPSDVSGCPDVLTFSLEKRIIPRFSVIRLLQSEGLISKENVSIISILTRSEKVFLEKYVIKYQDQVPELLSILQGKISLGKFGLGFDARGGGKRL